MDDSKIIDLFFERSELAIIELSQKYGTVCKKTADSILDNALDSEECVNDVYLAVWNTIPPQRPDPLISYVCRITRNTAIARYRHNSAAKRNSRYDVALCELEDCFASAQSVEDEADAHEIAQKISDYLRTLDEQSRALFIRRYYRGDPVEDLADEFSVSRHSVNARLSRIRKKLKDHLSKEGIYL